MTGIAIYLEGGGDTAQQKAELRTGMDALLGPQKQAARAKRLGWRTIPCGGRQQTFNAFKNALQHADAEPLFILLVDSEDAVASETNNADVNAKARAQHLINRDHWDLSGVDAKQ